MILEMMIPGAADNLVSGEAGELIWDFAMPSDQGDNEYFVKIACSDNYFDGVTYLGAEREKDDFPHSLSKKANDGDQLFAAPAGTTGDSVTLKVDASNNIYISYDGPFAQNVDDKKKYWIVFPTRTSNDVSGISDAAAGSDANVPDTCVAQFMQRTEGLYTRTWLQINKNDNGPRYYYTDPVDGIDLLTHFREGYTASESSSAAWTGANKIWMNFKHQLEFNNGEGDGTNFDDMVVQQRMAYGMTTDAWCLVKLPAYFKPSGTSAVSSTLGNLTAVTSWNIDLGDGLFDDEVFYLTYHAEDVWPLATNTFHLTNVVAPYGEQQDYTMPTGYT